MKLEEKISNFAHEVEEVFKDVKENVILTVERHSLVIALALMALTTAVLLIGTLYMWCFHHPSKTERSRSATQEQKKKSENGPKEMNEQQEKEKEQNGQKSEVEDPEVETHQTDMAEVSNEIQEESQGVKNVEEKEGKVSEVSEVRKRIPSNNSSVNNNESPVKSKIPIRRSTSRTKQS